MNGQLGSGDKPVHVNTTISAIIKNRPENIYRTIIYKIVIRRPKYDWKILLIYYITVKSLANIQS